MSHLNGSQKRRLLDALLLSDPSLLEAASLRFEDAGCDASQNGRVFPLELLTHIFHLLDCAALLRVQLVCRLWRAEVLADPSHWKRLFFAQCTFVQTASRLTATTAPQDAHDKVDGKPKTKLLAEDSRDEEGYFLFERDWKAFYFYCKKNYFDRRAPQHVLEAIGSLQVGNPNQARAVNPEGARNFLFSILGDSIMPKLHGNYFESVQRGATPIWFDWDGAQGCWWWSPDRDWWIRCPEVTVTGGIWFNQKPVEANQAIIRFLGQHPYAPTFIKKSLCFTTQSLAESTRTGSAKASTERLNFDLEGDGLDDEFDVHAAMGGGGNDQVPNCQQQ